MYIILVICGWVPIAGVKLDFGIFYGTYCFSPLSFFCAIYTLKIQTINNCSKWWRNRLVHCQHHFMLWCWSLSGQKKINKSAGTDTKMIKYGLMVWCIRTETDKIYPIECYLTRAIRGDGHEWHQNSLNPTEQEIWGKTQRVLQKGIVW